MEQFQVLLSFLASLRGQKENEIFAYQSQITKDSMLYKSEISVMLAQRNLITMIQNLPEAVQLVEDQINAQKEQAEKFKKAQE